MDKQNKKWFTRRNFIKTGLLGAAAGLSYTRWIEPKFLSITHKEIFLPHLPEALDGVLIAQLCDIHYQPDWQEPLITEAVEVVNTANPDLITLIGDYITSSTDAFSPLMGLLGKLHAKHGVYGVMGNHDCWHKLTSEALREFKKAGFEFLINQGTGIKINHEKLHLIGTDSIWAGEVDIAACYRGHQKDEPVIALIHEPDFFDTLRHDHRVDLQLSGHTHGGQCRVPFIDYAPVKVKYGKNYIQGEYQKDDSTIFVSRGLGTVNMRVRFACTPEVAFLTLKSGRS